MRENNNTLLCLYHPFQIHCSIAVMVSALHCHAKVPASVLARVGEFFMEKFYLRHAAHSAVMNRPGFLTQTDAFNSFATSAVSRSHPGSSSLHQPSTRGLATSKRSSSPVPVEANLSFVEPGHRWAHSPSPSKAPGVSYQGTMKTSVRMLLTSGSL